MIVDRKDRGLSQSLLQHGYWEMWLTEALEAMLRPSMIALDIGANLGYFSLLMAQKVGLSGRVHAFEPNPEIAAMLRQSAGRGGWDRNIAVHAEPLWDADGLPASLKVPEGEPKNAHLIPSSSGHEGALQLLTRRLDSFPDLLDADVIKIDVEGAEEPIWRGMAGLLERKRPLTIFLEFTPTRYADPAAFLDVIEQQEFVLRELSVSYGARSVSKAEILAGSESEDRILALVRR